MFPWSISQQKNCVKMVYASATLLDSDCNYHISVTSGIPAGYSHSVGLIDGGFSVCVDEILSAERHPTIHTTTLATFSPNDISQCVQRCTARRAMRHKRSLREILQQDKQ